MACARDVKARKIDAGGVFDAPIFRAHGRGSLLEDPILPLGHAQTMALDHYVCANYSNPSSDLV